MINTTAATVVKIKIYGAIKAASFANHFFTYVMGLMTVVKVFTKPLFPSLKASPVTFSETRSFDISAFALKRLATAVFVAAALVSFDLAFFADFSAEDTSFVLPADTFPSLPARSSVNLLIVESCTLTSEVKSDLGAVFALVPASDVLISSRILFCSFALTLCLSAENRTTFSAVLSIEAEAASSFSGEKIAASSDINCFIESAKLPFFAKTAPDALNSIATSICVYNAINLTFRTHLHIKWNCYCSHAK